jgi:NAD(P)-dependent dehydrogenase (short-subunit alcohol dehydrogenase family)
VCDFSKVAEIEEKINGVVKENGAFDGLVFCVGIDASRPFKMCKYDYMLKAMNINFFSFIELLRAITKKGNYNRCGLSVVGISSVGAYLGNPSQTAYTASKAAMNGAVRSIAKELYSKGVRINTIAPGTTDTKMFREAESALSDSDGFKSRLDRQYMGLCKPSDIANGILFLLSDMSKMISGSCLNIDGGKLTS